MQDFTIISLFFLEMLLAVASTVAFICRCRFLNTFCLLQQKYLKLIKNKDLPIYYSTSTLKKIARNKTLHLPTLREDILSFMAMKNINKTAPLIRHYVKRFPNNTKLLLLDAEISHLQNNQTDFCHLIEQVNLPRFISKEIKAKYNLLLAKNEIYQTDMLSASKHISAALEFYKKSNDSYNEALCYQTLSEIYRISGVFDVAYTMLKEAKKIYTKLQINAKLAETKAYFGLIEIGRENSKEAQKHLKSAAQICIKYHLPDTLTNIKNWQGLVAYTLKQYANAKIFFEDVLDKANSTAQKAFASEMLARTYTARKNYTKALQYVHQALLFAEEEKHYPSIFECLYLKAEIYYTLKEYTPCRQILTTLIKTKNPPSAIYYPANAYTLLGLVEAKENNLNAACTLFKQALDLEHSQNRLKGAAIDYNNLAEISRQQGLAKDAEKYLKKALDYAKEIDDKELINFLKTKQ